MSLSRRAFLTGCFATGAAHAWAQSEPFPWNEIGAALRARYSDLRRHFVFEYYPWYANTPFRHWQQWGRQPPADLAAPAVPLLGAYDSRSTSVIEQHARWIAESGVGVVNLSWWRPGSFSDRAAHRVMDVMHAHDIKVTFHIEPYGPERADFFAADIRHLLTEYGEKRGWDAFFLHERADGTRGPVFKLFAATLPKQIRNCRDEVEDVPLHVPDSRWRRAIDRVRAELDGMFDHVTLLANTAAHVAKDIGLDGIAIYDPSSAREGWPDLALAASQLGLVFSFNSNPGLDEIERRKVLPDSCYVPRPFLPRTAAINWTQPDDRARAQELSAARIRETLEWSLALQTHPWLGNVDQGFFLIYLTSFNEWHEGTQFEPMKDREMLTPTERSVGYHNVDNGRYRLEAIASLLGRL